MELKRKFTLSLAVIGLISAIGVTGCVVAPPPPPPHPHPVKVVQVQERVMPAIIVEDPGRPPAAGMHWVKGYWHWEREQWVWQVGHWVANPVPPMPAIIVEERPPAPSPVHYWVQGHWVWRDNIHNWTWVQGQWRN